MKKISIALGLVGLLALTAWSYRAELMLSVLKYRSHSAFEITETIDIPWTENFPNRYVGQEIRPPNIILIVVDDLGYNDLSVTGGGIIQTPAIDHLASSGAMFTQSYSGANTCAPSRAMIMTGRYPTRNGLEFTPTAPGMNNALSILVDQSESLRLPFFYDEDADEQLPPFAEQGLPTEEYTIAELLRDNGYYTALIGKWHLGRSSGMAPNDQGFHDSLLMASGLYLPEDDDRVVNAKLSFDPIDQVLWSALTYANSFNTANHNRFKPGGYLTDYWTDEAIEVIKKNKSNPFFLYLAHFAPHTPLQATVEDYQTVGPIFPHRKRVYAAMIKALDRSVENLMQTLKSEGLDDNTIIIFTSDNGGADYIGLPEVNRPFRGWKRTMFEGGIRVPLFVRWPAKISEGTVVQQPVSHIDLFPTIAAASGSNFSKQLEIDGENLFTLIHGEEDRSWDRTNLFWQNGHYKAVRHRDWKLQINDDPTTGIKYWLNDLSQDPTEQINLADSNPQMLEKLLNLLNEHQKDATPPRYPSVIQSAVLVDKTLLDEYVDGDEYVYSPN